MRRFLFAILALTLLVLAHAEPLSTIHITFMNHFDAGFTNTVENVVNLYFDEFYPKAIRVAQELRIRGGPEALVYTTHPWLASLYVNCPKNLWPGLHCPNATMLNLFSEAVKRGDITWHAFPFNAEPEFMDDSLFQYALTMAQDLSDKFGVPRVKTMSQRDVPGMTRAVIPLLVKNGIQAVSVGVNGASAPPAVPRIFRWRDQPSDTEVLAMWNPGGYGSYDSEDDLRKHVVTVPDFSDGIAFYFRTDNAGPPDAAEVLRAFTLTKILYPGVTLRAAKFDDFVSKIVAAPQYNQLPVITAEIGDTWLYGVPSDPLKVAQFRAALRAREDCLDQGVCHPDDPTFKEFNRLFVKIAEHTWGTDVKYWLHDFYNWSNARFEKARGQENYQHLEGTWREQRSFMDMALKALGAEHPLAVAIRKEFAQLRPRIPSTQGYAPVNPSGVFTVGNLEIGFDKSGGINRFVDLVTKRNYASSEHVMGQVVYQTFDGNDYDKFFANYFYCDYRKTCAWAPLDFGKPNVSLGEPVHATYKPQLTQLWHKVVQGNVQEEFLLEMNMDSHPHEFAGAPSKIWLSVVVDSANTALSLTLYVMNKTATRLPESLSFAFTPQVPDADSWYMDVMGSWISPLEVMRNGSHHQHGVTEGIHYVPKTTKKPELCIESTDAAVMILGDLTPFPTPLDGPVDMSKGFAFNLNNNIWGTNYVMWYPFDPEDADMLFRFRVKIHHH
jgi:hypothetical protein